MMRMLFVCAAAALLVSGCATTQQVQDMVKTDAAKVIAEEVNPQLSKLNTQIVFLEMTCKQLEQQVADAKAVLGAQKAAMTAAQKAGNDQVVADIKALVEKAVRALDAKISQLDAGMTKMKADIAEVSKAVQSAAATAAVKTAPAPAPAPAAVPAPAAKPVK